MTNRKDLIAKLEAATEGSRELDVAIYRFNLPHPAVSMASVHQQRFDLVNAPHYTTSLDDALTLVPEGYAFSVSDAARSRANVWAPSAARDTPPAYSKGPTPALALCIAALKASD